MSIGRCILLACLCVAATPAVACTACEVALTPDSRVATHPYQRFRRAWTDGNHAAAEAEIARLLQAGVRGSAHVAEYWIFERNQCDLSHSGPGMDKALSSVEFLREGLLVCNALASPDDLPQNWRLLAQIQDGRIPRSKRAHEVFDRYARQPTVNAPALAWLKRHGLAETSFWNGDDSALLTQILAGRVDNVRILLDAGYDPNLALSRTAGDNYSSNSDERAVPGISMARLPLQAARDALAAHGESALEITRILLANGADPTKLHWHVPTPTAPSAAAPPAVLARYDALLAESAARFDAIRAEPIGLILENSPGDVRLYARFLIGNGSKQAIAIPVWKDGGERLFGDFHGAHLEWRMAGGDKWHRSLLIQHGRSSSEHLVITAGQSREVLYDLNLRELLGSPADLRYRLQFRVDDDWHASQPFAAHGWLLPMQTVDLGKPRRW